MIFFFAGLAVGVLAGAWAVALLKQREIADLEEDLVAIARLEARARRC